MPEYLQFAGTLLELDQQATAARLHEQFVKLESAISRLKDTEKAPENLFEMTVSI